MSEIRAKDRRDLADVITRRLSWASAHWFPTRSRGGIKTAVIDPDIATEVAKAIVASPWYVGRVPSAGPAVSYMSVDEYDELYNIHTDGDVEELESYVNSLLARRARDAAAAEKNRADEATAEAERLRTGLRCLVRDWAEGWDDADPFDQRDAYQSLTELLGEDFANDPTWKLEAGE